MKKLIGSVLLFTNLIALKTFANADILSVRQISSRQLKISVSTIYHCNNPKGELVPKASYTNKRNIYIFELGFTAVNRMYCGGTKEQTEVQVDLPSEVNPGDAVVILGENNTSATIEIGN